MYLYRLKLRALRTNASVSTNTAMPTAIQIAWVGATWMGLPWLSRSGCRSRRVSITNPMPRSRLTSGSSVASARGASRRTATCAAPNRPTSTANNASVPAGIAGAVESPRST